MSNGSSQMLCAKFVAQLHNLPESEGFITAFTSHGKYVFLGTTLGFVHTYRVSVKPTSEKQIFTTLTTRGCLIDKKKVTRLVHSPTRDVLFALCGRRIHLLDSRKLSILKVLSEEVSDFWMSGGFEHCAGMHMLTCAVSGRKEVIVINIDVDRLAEEVVHTLILPEPVQQVVEHNGIVCLGLRREYSMLSIHDGDSKSLLALTGNAAPMLAFGGSDVFMRLGETVFVVSMKHMPSSSHALRTTIRFPEEPRALVYAHPFLFGFCKSFCNVYSWYDGDIVEELPMEDCCFASPNVVNNTIFCASRNKFWLIRTVSLEHQLEQLVMKGKIDQALDLLRCQPIPSRGARDGDGLSNGDDQGATRSQLSSRQPRLGLIHLEANLNVMIGFYYLYNNAPLEAIGHFGSFVDVREPLLHLPDLMPLRRSRERISHWLRAFHSADGGRRATGLCATSGPFGWCIEMGADPSRMALLAMTCHDEDADNDVERAFWSGFRPRHPHSRLWGQYYLESSADSTPVAPSPLGGGEFPPHGGSPSAVSVREVLTSAWATAFYRDGQPLSELHSGAGLHSGDHRRVFETHSVLSNVGTTQHTHVALGLDEYLEMAEDRLKEELVRWLSSRLETCAPLQRRAAEFALFTLYSQANDRRSLFLMAGSCEFVRLADVWDLLASPSCRSVDSQGEPYPLDDLVMSPLCIGGQDVVFPDHDALSRALGLSVSCGEWRVLYLLLQRSRGPLGDQLYDPSRLISNSCEGTFFFNQYLSTRSISEASKRILMRRSGKAFVSGFSSDCEEEDVRDAQRRNVLLSTMDRHRVYSLDDPHVSLNKGRQWPLLLRDYVEACRQVYAAAPSGDGGAHVLAEGADTPYYPRVMYLPLDFVAGQSRGGVQWTFRCCTVHELFFAVESGDHRYVSEVLHKQHEEHACYLRGLAVAPSTRTSCWATLDEEGNNAFHILFVCLLRALHNAARASQHCNGASDDTEATVHTSTQTSGGDSQTRRNADRRARQLAALAGRSTGGCVSGEVLTNAERIQRLYGSAQASVGAAAHCMSSDAAMAILCVLLGHGCSEISTRIGFGEPTSHALPTEDGHVLSAFRESLGCALANPSSLLLLTMPNRHGVTPLQMVEVFPTSDAERATEQRFSRDPNSHAFELVVSFILAQLRVLTVPE